MDDFQMVFPWRRLRNVEVVFENRRGGLGKRRNERHVATELAERENEHVGLIEPRVLVVEVDLEHRKVLFSNGMSRQLEGREKGEEFVPLSGVLKEIRSFQCGGSRPS